MTIRTMAMTTLMTTIKEKPPLKLRHELKYRSRLRDDRILASRLGKMCIRDSLSGYAAGGGRTGRYFFFRILHFGSAAVYCSLFRNTSVSDYRWNRSLFLWGLSESSPADLSDGPGEKKLSKFSLKSLSVRKKFLPLQPQSKR